MRHFARKSSHSIETLILFGICGKMSLLTMVCWARYKFQSSILSPHGFPPTNISTIVQPKLQISLLLPDPSSLMTSGAIHYTLPRIYDFIDVKLLEILLLPNLNSLELPKSHSFIMPSLFVNMFEHLRSKCLIFCSCKYCRPFSIY